MQLCTILSSENIFLVPVQQLPQRYPVQCTHPEQVNTSDHQQDCSYPIQVEGDEESSPVLAGYHNSWQAGNIQTQRKGVVMFQDGMPFHDNNSEQLQQQNRQLQMELKAKNNEIHDLSNRNNQLQQSS